MRSVNLHESHRQSLAAGLRLIEEHLNRIEVLLKGLKMGDSSSSILERTAEEERNDIQQKVVDLRQTAREFAERFSIAPEEASVRQMLAGEVAATWLILEGCRPRHLRNNGAEMEPSVSAALEDGVQELLTKILILRGKLR
jgi:hypothetical protein